MTEPDAARSAPAGPAAQPQAGPAAEALAATPLVDHHCHGVFRGPVSAGDVAASLGEGDGRDPRAGSPWASRLGLGVRARCAPLLDLDPHVPVTDYLARRAALGEAEVGRRLLGAAGVGTLLVDTGAPPPDGVGGLTSPPELAALAGPGVAAFEVVRLEALAEAVVTAGTTALGFADDVRAALDRALTGTGGVRVVAAKSVAAYRAGLPTDGRRPNGWEVAAAAARWLRRRDPAAQPRCASDTLHRFLVWEAVDRRLPVQFHTGMGDNDADLRRADPARLHDLLRRTAPTGVPVLLLHTYPFHRAAGHLAQVFGHVFADVGLALHGVGNRAPAVLAEALELVPFGSHLYSSDGFGLPELHLAAAASFRSALAGVLDGGVRAGDWGPDDAVHAAVAIAAGNADRVYDLTSAAAGTPREDAP